MHWSEYVTQHAEGRNQADLALRVGTSQSSISRWKKGQVPAAQSVIDFARAVGDSPVSALVASGHVSEREAGDVVRLAAGLSDAGDAEFVVELARRLGISVSIRGERAG